MTEWREYKLKELADFNPDSLTAKSKLQFINYLDTGNITKGKIDTIQYLNLSTDKVPSRAKRIVKKNDIVYSTVRPNQEHYGIIKNPVDNMIVSTGFVVLRSKEDKCYSDFLYYFLTLPENTEYLSNVAEDSTTAYPSITPDVIMDMDISLPPLPEQKAIAEVLSSLDDKIDLLTRQNKTLEDLAQAYFRKWFIEDASDEWEVGKLGDFVEVIDNRGKTPPYQDIPTEYPIIEVKSISGDNRFIDYQKCEKFVLESTYKTWFRGYIKPLDVLVSTVGSVGEIAQVLLEHGVIAQNVIGLRSKGTSPYHLFEYMKYMKNEIKELDIGSVQPSIKVPHLLSLQYVKPDRDSLRKFDDFSKELVNKMISNFMQIQTLQKLRDTLLPKLISGEIRVKM